MSTLYGLIDDLRREHPTPSASRTLDMVVAELGSTQDNLRDALTAVRSRPVPTGGGAVLDELEARAQAVGVDDERTPLSAEERKARQEPIGGGQIGIAVMLALSTVIPLVLAAAAIAYALIGSH